jgi:hypothetical protein
MTTTEASYQDQYYAAKRTTVPRCPWCGTIGQPCDVSEQCVMNQRARAAVTPSKAEKNDLSAWTPYPESTWAALDEDGEAPWEPSYGQDYDGADDER